MTFSIRDWLPGQILTAALLEDMETRLSAYTDLLTSWVNVKDYGALGDGTTSDSTAVAAAISACSSAGGGTVFFPRGTYQIGTMLSVPTNVRLVGTGKNTSVLRKTGNITLLNFSGSSNSVRCQRGGIMDLRLDGGGFTGTLVNCKWADHMNFDRIWCYNNGGKAWYMENVWDTYFNNVEFDTCSGIDGFNPSVLIASNSDDSTNIIVFNECRWENFIDGALWITTGAMVSAYTPVTGSNPSYGVYLNNCKFETPQLRGLMFVAAADVATVHFDGMYVAARGLYTGITTGRTLFSLLGADMVFKRMRVYINGVTNPTVKEVFSLFNGGNAGSFEDITFDVQQNPSTSLFTIAGGSPDFTISNVQAKIGQTPTMFSGTWPVQVASAGTLTLPQIAPMFVITGTTNITNITAQLPGRRVTLKFNGILTVTDGGNLRLPGSFATAADSTIDLICDGTNWYEIGRSSN